MLLVLPNELGFGKGETPLTAVCALLLLSVTARQNKIRPNRVTLYTQYENIKQLKVPVQLQAFSSFNLFLFFGGVISIIFYLLPVFSW
jgi:hypothetical protein